MTTYKRPITLETALKEVTERTSLQGCRPDRRDGGTDRTNKVVGQYGIYQYRYYR